MKAYDEFCVFVFQDDSNISREKRLQKSAGLFEKNCKLPLSIAKTPKGKPYFCDREDIFFSVTHSGRYWMCAMGYAPVGLDLQIHGEYKIETLSKRFLHPKENEYLLGRGYSPEDFFDIWVKKESFLKYTGEGLPRGLDSFNVTEKISAEFKMLPFMPGYSLCMCAEKISSVNIYNV